MQRSTVFNCIRKRALSLSVILYPNYSLAVLLLQGSVHVHVPKFCSRLLTSNCATSYVTPPYCVVHVSQRTRRKTVGPRPFAPCYVCVNLSTIYYECQLASCAAACSLLLFWGARPVMHTYSGHHTRLYS